MNYNSLTLKSIPFQKNEIIKKLEQTTYINDLFFIDYYVYVCSGIRRLGPGAIRTEFDYIGYNQILQSSCYHKGRIGEDGRDSDPFFINITFDKEKVFPFYDPYIYQVDIARSLKNGEQTLHDLIFETIDVEYSALIKGEQQKIYDWMDIEIWNNQRKIYISLPVSIPINKNFYEILSDPSVWQQIIDSNLDLENTKCLILKGFPSFSTGWGMLLYDDSNEYYLPFYPMYYSQDYVEAAYLKNSEFLNLEFKEYQLYNVKKDLAPYILRERLLLEKAGERALQEQKTDIPFDPNG